MTSISPGPKLLEATAEVPSRDFKSNSHTLKYIGIESIDALGKVIQIHTNFGQNITWK